MTCAVINFRFVSKNDNQVTNIISAVRMFKANKIYLFDLADFVSVPSIAQLVERWTVVEVSRKSIGHWFESGSKDLLLNLIFKFIGQGPKKVVFSRKIGHIYYS